MTSAREKFFYTRTLCCLLKALEGVETEIELRNESHVKGTIESVSSAMGVTMRNCELIVAGRIKQLQRLFVQGRKIRMVVVPDDIDMIDAMQGVINMFNAPVLGRDEFKKCRRGRGEGRGRGISCRGRRGRGLRGARGRTRGGVPWGGSNTGDAGRGHIGRRGRGSSDGGRAGRGQVFGSGRGSRIGGDAGRGQVFGRGRGSGISGDAGTSQVYGYDSGSAVSSDAGRGEVLGFGRGCSIGDMYLGTGTGKIEPDQTRNQSGSVVGSLLHPDYMLQAPAGHSQTLSQVPVPPLGSTSSCAGSERSLSQTDLRHKIWGGHRNPPFQEGSSLMHRDKSGIKKESLSGHSHDSSSGSEGGKSHRIHSPRNPTSEQAAASSSGSKESSGERESVKGSFKSQIRHFGRQHDYPKHHTRMSHKHASPSREARHSHSCRSESSQLRDFHRHDEKYYSKTESKKYDSRSCKRISPGRESSLSWHSERSPGRDDSRSARNQHKDSRRSSSTCAASREHKKSSRRPSHAADHPKSSRSSVRDQSTSSRRKSPARDDSKHI